MSVAPGHLGLALVRAVAALAMFQAFLAGQQSDPLGTDALSPLSLIHT